MQPETRRNIAFLVSWFVLFVGTFFISQLSQKEDFNALILFYTGSFIVYLAILKLAHSYSKQTLYLGFVILVLITFLQAPYLSNDYYRFLWDGEMIHLGYNPYQFTPDQLIHNTTFNDCYYLDLYAGMGELSQSNYSCYPSINQGYFYLSTLFSKSIFLNVFVLRLLILCTILISIFYLEKLLLLFQLNVKRIFILLLNPLVIIESFANLHFELVMVAFLLMALYFLLRQKYLLSAILFALAIQVKLIPLLILPFLLSYLGWKNALRYYLYTGVFTILLFAFLLRMDNYENFLMSLRLYFNRFEFNSFLLYPYVEYGKVKYGFNLISKYGPELARMALLIILGIAWKKRVINSGEMMTRIMWGIMVYFFFTSTVHPWYWVLPLSLSIITFSWTLILITFFAILSYGLYSFSGIADYRNLLAYINLGLIFLYGLEVFRPHLFSNFNFKVLDKTTSSLF